MAEFFDTLNDRHIAMIDAQPMFFVATAGAEGTVNVSPKGMDTLRVLGEDRIVWLNLSGSGNETAAHLLEDPRMTIMFCSFDKQPVILRLYGKSKTFHERDDRWEELSQLFPRSIGARQIFELDVDLVQTSCGYAVPLYDFKAERPTLVKWVEQKSNDEVKDYWREKNVVSLDGKQTGIFEDKN